MTRSSWLLGLLVLAGGCRRPEGGAAPAETVGSPRDARANLDSAPARHALLDGEAAPRALVLPPTNGGLDYQLGGIYPPPASVAIVARDRRAPPAAGRYNICYVNGFQAQPDERAFWLGQHPELVLRDATGEPVIDPDWDELLLDVSTEARRAALAALVSGWIAGCKQAGFDAIEIDNLDSFTRAGGRLREDDAVAAMRLYADAAHAHGLPIAQKNAAELVPRRAEMATDFVVAEECNRFAECGAYTAAYGDHVLVVEYRRADFDVGCAAFPGLSIVLRDRELAASGQRGHVFAGC